MIDITGTDLRKFIVRAYELSAPQGLGFLHYTPDPPSEEAIDFILAHSREPFPVQMDYVSGRAVKMTIHTMAGGRLAINDRWFDHTEKDLKELLSSDGVVNNGAYSGERHG